MELKLLALLSLCWPYIAFANANNNNTTVSQKKQRLISQAEDLLKEALAKEDQIAHKILEWLETETKTRNVSPNNHATQLTARQRKVSKRGRRRAPSHNQVKDKKKMFKEALSNINNALKQKDPTLAATHIDDFFDHINSDKDRDMFADIYYHEGITYGLLGNQHASYYSFLSFIAHASNKHGAPKKLTYASAMIDKFKEQYPSIVKAEQNTSKNVKAICEQYDFWKK